MTLPPLNGLLALEAVIRLGSVSRAAEELRVSQPAVSQRLRVLSDFFGRPMITRTSTGFHVEPDVELYAARLHRALQDMEAASDTFRAQSHLVENRLTIALLATFAQRWLIPRLAGFQEKHPEIDVQLLTTSDPTDLLRPDADISIRCGSGKWRGCTARFLMANDIFPVASPGFLESNTLRRLDDLRGVALIQVDAPPRTDDWPVWLEAQGLPDLQPKTWQTYSNSTHALEAATAGLGVAMAHTPFAADSVASGRLIKLFDRDWPDRDGAYYVVHSARSKPPRRVQRFSDWLIGEVRKGSAKR